jgi:hypothetical protein
MDFRYLNVSSATICKISITSYWLKIKETQIPDGFVPSYLIEGAMKEDAAL